MKDDRPDGASPADTAPRESAGRRLPTLDILVVDDERRIRRTVRMCLEDDGHRVESVGTADQAARAADRQSFDMAFVDLRLPGRSGMELIPALLDCLPWLKIVVITAHASVESAVEATKRGAVDYLPKPFSTSEVRMAARKVAELRGLEDRVGALESQVEQGQPSPLLESRSGEMSRAIGLAREVADTDATVLLLGDSGTGKGVLARAIHRWSGRSEAPFGVAHCPSFPRELLESELFGHVKGAFTGAVQSNPGRISRCEGGTLFLDEIGDLPEPLQPKLLRLLEEGEFERLGDPTTRQADVRIIAATNRDLEERVAEGSFREDLYYRLNVVEIELPPLAERRDDILPLADRFLGFYREQHGSDAERFSAEAEQALTSYRWPGNVRELENAVERAVILAPGEEIRPGHLPFGSDREGTVPRVGDRVSLDEIEEEHIRRVVAATESLEEAADVLGIDTTTLWRRRKKFDL